MSSLDAGLVIERLAAALLALAVGSLLLRELAAGIWALALQSLLLVAIGVVAAASTGETHAWVAAGLTFAVKVVAIPLVLRAALGRVRLKREVDPVLPDRIVLLLGIALAALAYRAAGPLQLPGAALGHGTLPASIGLMLVGLLIMVVRRKALSQVMGLVTLENGIYLAALAVSRPGGLATEGLPLAVELAVAFDVLVGAIVMAIMAQRISQTFQTINVDQLRALRDRPSRLAPDGHTAPRKGARR
ncbi:MAG TPA: NADH-quinone oxidoreductase subunit K [Chloroflexota bacterium]|jgi:hydrogenase-4 component E|nr:NADH-quinone oxidoreductase subunit K [Chloroflexota bacterium]